AHFPQFGIAKGDDGALAAWVDHDVGDRRHQSRHMNEMPGLDSLMCELLEHIFARGFLRIAHRSADRSAATEPYDSDRGVERIAAADLVEMTGIHFEAAARQFLDSECEVADRHPDA